MTGCHYIAGCHPHRGYIPPGRFHSSFIAGPHPHQGSAVVALAAAAVLVAVVVVVTRGVRGLFR